MSNPTSTAQDRVAPRILIDLMSNGTQFEFDAANLGVEPAGLTAEKVIAALKDAGSKGQTASDLGLLDERIWSLYVQVITPDGVTRAEW